MTKSTFPNEWLQPIVTEKLQELNREATKDFVTVEKKVFDTLQKNNLDLMERLDEAKEALRFYAADENYYMRGTYGKTNVRDDNGKIAKEALREIEK